MSQCQNCHCELGPCDPREFCCLDCQDEYNEFNNEDDENENS